jgi:glycosyltransferase involved in cell wall biosynthesis
MKISIVAPGRDFVYAAKHPLELAEVLAKHGHTVTMVAPMPKSIERLYINRGFKIRSYSPRLVGVPPSLGSVERLALALARSFTKTDVCIGVDPLGFMVAHGMKQLHRTRMLVYYAMELCLPEETPQTSVNYQSKHIAEADLVITTGIHRAEVMYRQLHLRQMPLVLHNTTALVPPNREPMLRREMCRQGYAPSEKLVLFAGKLFEPHGLTEILDSMRYWSPDTGLVLIGYGDCGYVEHLRSLANANSIADRFFWLGTAAPGAENILPLIAGADVGLALKKHRGAILNDVYYTPSKLLEYAAMGVPVVCSNQTSLRHVEVEGWGRCVDPESPEEIAGAITCVLKSHAHAVRMGAVGRRLYEQKYCMERQVEPLLAAIDGFAN